MMKMMMMMALVKSCGDGNCFMIMIHVAQVMQKTWTPNFFAAHSKTQL